MDTEDSGPATLEALGIPRTHATTDSILGKRRTWEDLQKWEVAFLVIAPVSMLVMLGFTIYKVTQTDDDDFTFGIVLIISIVFCFFYVIDGVLGERPYEISIFLIGGVVVLVYIISNYAAPGAKRDTVKLVRLVLICVLAPINLGFAIWAAKDYYISRRLIFRTVGADEHLQGACASRLLFIALLKIHVQVALSILVLIVQGRDLHILEKIILGVGIPFTIIWCLLGYLSVRFENKTGSVLFLATCWALPAYVGYKVTVTIQSLVDPSIPERDLPINIMIMLFAVASILIQVTLVITTVNVYKTYGIGLKEKMYPKDARLIFSRNKKDGGEAASYSTFR